MFWGGRPRAEWDTPAATWSRGFLPSEAQAASRPDLRHASVAGPLPRLGAAQAHLPACACRCRCGSALPATRRVEPPPAVATCRGLGHLPTQVPAGRPLPCVERPWGRGSFPDGTSRPPPAGSNMCPPSRKIRWLPENGWGDLGQPRGSRSQPLRPSAGRSGPKWGCSSGWSSEPTAGPGGEPLSLPPSPSPPDLGPGGVSSAWATQDLALLGPREGHPPTSSGGPWGVEVRMGQVGPHAPPFLTPTCTLI